MVIRKLSFAGAGISHSAFGGIALGLLLGVPPAWAAVSFSLLVALLIGLMRNRQNLSEDVAIGIFFPASMALGIILLSATGRYYEDIFGYLFGSILTITPSDLTAIAATSALIVGATVLLFKELLFYCFDEEAAYAAGIPTRLVGLALLGLLALTVVASIRVTGVVLVSALLVVPGAAARQVTRNYRAMIAVSLLVGQVSSLGGLLLSYRWNLPPGSTIALLATAVFFLALGFRSSKTLLKTGRLR